MTSAIDITKPVYGAPTTQSVRDNFKVAHDEISALQGQTAAPQITATGGTVARYQADRAGETINIRDLGAACDGVTDDTAAWTAAFAMPSGTVIRIPQNCVTVISDGNFRATGSRSISIVGDGRNSVIRFKAGLTQANQFFTWFGGSTRNVRLQDFTFDYNSNPPPASLLTIFGIQQTTGFRMVNVAVINCATNIYIVNPNNCADLVFDQCLFQVTTPSQTVQSKAVVVSGSLGVTTNLRMTDCVCVNTNTNFANTNRIYFAGNDVSGWGVGAGIATDAQNSNHIIVGNDFHDSQPGQDMFNICPNGIEQWSSLTTVANNRCWNNSGNGIAIGGADCTVIGNSCWDNGTSLGVGGTMAGISLVAASPYFGSNCLVIGNKCWDTQGRQNYGFKINNSGITNVTLDGNIFKGSTADWLPGNATFLPIIDYTPRTLVGRKMLYQSTTSVGNGADITLDVLQTFTVPANTLLNVGDRIIFRAGGTFTSLADSRTLQLQWGGSNVGGITVSAVSQQSWRLEGEIIKTGTNAQTISLAYTTNSNQCAANSTAVTRGDNTALVLAIAGQNSTNPTAASVTCRYFTVDYSAVSG